MTNQGEIVKPATVIKPMGSKFKQQIKEIEEAKKAEKVAQENTVNKRLVD